MKLSIAGITDIGTVRYNNQDNYIIGNVFREDVESPRHSHSTETDTEPQLFGVCDGMGGASRGEMASYLAVSTLAKLYPYEHFNQKYERIFEAVNQAVCDYTAENNLSACGSTIVLFYVNHNRFTLYNVGDSAGYFFRDGKLKKLSKDHTLYQQYLDLGIRLSSGKNALTQYLGVDPDEFMIEPYITEKTPLRHGDILFCCSDGVYNAIEEKELAEIFSSPASAQEKVSTIIEKCRENKCRDNVTAVIAEVE
ncbi:MAG: serine/threonine-protein phosphatase [Clostridia bacterium]|nr:serine/threonine-protein phosphatase [Clostridia bacterium]